MASGAPRLIGPFEGVEDSPFLRMQMRALESDVDEPASARPSSPRTAPSTATAWRMRTRTTQLLRVHQGLLRQPRSLRQRPRRRHPRQVHEQRPGDRRRAKHALGAVESILRAPPPTHTLDLKDVRDAQRFDRCSGIRRARARFLSLTKDTKAESLRNAEDELNATRRVLRRRASSWPAPAADSASNVEFKRPLTPPWTRTSASSRSKSHPHRLEPFAHEVLQRCDERRRGKRDALASAMTIQCRFGHPSQRP